MIDFEVRDSWKNHLGNQTIDPLRIYEPATIADVVSIVQLAEQAGVTARAVGSGHSWSDVALTEGFLMKTEPAGARARAGAGLPRAGVGSGRRLVRVEAGIRHQGAQRLPRRARPRPDEHGRLRPPDDRRRDLDLDARLGDRVRPAERLVRSLDLVTAGGVVRRVERTDGPTDRDRLRGSPRRPAARSSKTTHVFDAVVVGMGCMGVICTAMIEVRRSSSCARCARCTRGRRSAPTSRTGAVFADNRHYEIIFSPYADKARWPTRVS